LKDITTTEQKIILAKAGLRLIVELNYMDFR